MKRSRSSLAALVERYQIRSHIRFRIGIYTCLAAVLYVVLVGSVLPQRYNVSVGQVSQVLITAPIAAVDTYATNTAQAAAAAMVTPRYDINPQVVKDAIVQLDRLFNTLQSLQAASGLSNREQLAQLQASAPSNLSTKVLHDLLDLNSSQALEVASDSVNITERMLQGQFSASDRASAGLLVDQQLVSLDADAQTRMMIGSVVLSVLRPNLVFDPVATELARVQAERSIPDVWINRGDVIVQRGQLVTPAIMDQLRDLKLLKNQPDYGLYIGFLLFICVLVLATAAFIQVRRGRVSRDNVHLLLYTGLLVPLAIIIRIVKASVDVGLPAGVTFAIPVAMGSMMIAMFFGTSLAMLSSVLIAMLESAAFGFEFQYFYTALMGALAATMAMTRAQNRRIFMRAGFWTAALNMVGITIMHFLQGTNVSWSDFAYQLLYGVLGGFLSAVLAMGLLPYLETTFGVTTHIGLLELANPNHPLLRRLLLEAPGTYHHSLIVGNLAEAAAEAVGADPLTCRVGAYYHDVGKMRRPIFFIENQMSEDNPHDKIAPTLSHLIVTSHVEDGLNLLREHNLPESIRDICAEHHGTTVLWYFYNRAVEEDKHRVPDIDQFRYPGPRPRSKEAAIVMICDAVEASVRAIGKPTPHRIEAMIRKIIKDRLQDGQLDECDITMRDLDCMVAAFMRVLQGIYHERIEYPDPARILEAARTK